MRPGEAGQLASGESRAWARVVGEPPPMPPRLHCVCCAPTLASEYKIVPREGMACVPLAGEAQLRAKEA